MVPMPDQSVAVANPDFLRIYVLRDTSERPSIHRVLVYEGELQIGSIHEREYLCWERRPGRTLLTAVHELSESAGENRQVDIEVEGAAGEVRYYGISISTGQSMPSLFPLEPERARELLGTRLPPRTP